MRPGRKMPTAKRVCAHWNMADMDRRCWRCDCVCRPDRAHIIDRFHGGLDGPQNLVLLCPECHDEMPSFEPGEEGLALTWVRSSTYDHLIRVASPIVDLMTAWGAAHVRTEPGDHIFRWARREANRRLAA